MSRCWFSSHDLIRDRDADGRLILRCQVCRYQVAVLQTALVTGPCPQPALVRGQPQARATKKTAREKIIRAEGRFT